MEPELAATATPEGEGASGSPPGASEALPTLHRGGQISRYLLLERVGAGGMGLVWSAYDPELDRKLAIKLLRPRESSCVGSPEARARLLREAQAMARLSHPNVIAVHDVGEHHGQVFVAMEYVEGGTLDDWRRQAARPWRAIIERFAQAGRGLAAAHGAGLVHRDFKPDNVLLGDDGRARVTDFGLARSLDGEPDPLTPTDESEPGRPRADTFEDVEYSSSSGLRSALTRTGVMLGTPAYMAPEQFDAPTQAAARVDARSDQFSFCVALWEALYDQRPFTGHSLRELGEAVRAGDIVAPPAEAHVPGFLEQALRRGLSVDPERRWPDMESLVAELERDPAQGRRRWLAAGGLVACLVGVLSLAPLLGPRPQPEAAPLCPRAVQQLEGVWGQGHRRVLEAAYEPAEARELAEVLDRYAEDWLDMHADACGDTHLRGEQSERMLDRRMQCLDERKRRLAASVELLTDTAARPTLDEAALIVGELPSVARCGDPDYVDSQLPLPDDPAAAEEVLAIRDEIAVARTLLDAKHGSEATKIFEAARPRAAALEQRPLLAQIDAELAVATLEGSSESSSSCEQLERALFELVETGQDELAARAAIKLVLFRSWRRAMSIEEIESWLALVEAWHERSKAPPIERARAQLAAAQAYHLSGEREGGQARTMAALELLGVDADFGGLGDLSLGEANVAAAALNMLGVWHYHHGEYRAMLEALEQLDHLQRIYPIRNKAQRLLVVNNTATTKFNLGEWGETQAGYANMRRLLTGDRSIDDFDSAYLLTNFVELWLAQAQVLGDDPRDLDEQLIADMLRILGVANDASHDAVEEGLVLAALFYMRRGELERAHELLAHSPMAELERREDLGSARPMLAHAELALHERDPTQALAIFELAERRALANGPAEQPIVGLARTGQAQALLELRRPAQADERLDAAMASWDGLWAEHDPYGHPWATLTLDLMVARSTRQPQRQAELRERAAAIRARLRRELEGGGSPSAAPRAR
ncbi:serine/threonine protein kinase [Pseudenhygromyxa sp. WMMC2535]|uniref:serine/threonine-protein kinase n=1 Tax=Pseudenhygromyxa sp. WMMC2535 TaxID=2712867 RepID=UPI0015566F66|nr:serine/threonine-protein kinase [Pseudenhygromyxa sp. WMMC2535]NVB40639.1 serine/threonine protein kinase [Pseudenhygromyxa sp. WMMC2535]